MPWAAPRPCARCGRLGCTQHVRKAWERAQPVVRMRGRALQQERERLFRQHGYQCGVCKRVTLPRHLIRDHKIPLAEGGLDIVENTQPICRACHDEKTQQESQRGRERNRE